MAKSKEELKRLLVRMKEGSEEVGLKWDSLVAQMVKNLPAVQETWLCFLGQEDLLEKGWLPTPVLLPGEFHGQKSLVGYSSWGR